jgi:hypothetical protein
LFPDACILQTHRDPVEVLPSYCSMIVALMSTRESVDPLAIGPIVLEYLARSLERGIAARERSDERRFFDVDYRALVADPIAEIGRVYDHYALPLTDDAQRAMHAFLAQNPQNKHGEHRYSLAEFGLTAERVRDRLRFYIRRFDLAGKGARDGARQAG